MRVSGQSMKGRLGENPRRTVRVHVADAKPARRLRGTDWYEGEVLQGIALAKLRECRILEAIACVRIDLPVLYVEG